MTGHFLDGRSWATVDDLCQDWDGERRRHPFYVCSLPDRLVDECWDSSADTYSGEGYASIRREILDCMQDCGMIGPDRTVLDIGCGPGLFTLPFSLCSSRVHCLDSSERMIQRVDSAAHTDGIGNITSQVLKWEDYETDEVFDTVFTSLCPALNNPESILRMESLSKDVCAYTSSVNHVDGLEVEVWKELGRDCSYRGYDTRFPYEFLKMIGRNPTIRFFSETQQVLRSPDKVGADLIHRFSGFGLDTEAVRCSVEKVVSHHEDNGTVSESRNVVLGLLTWSVPHD